MPSRRDFLHSVAAAVAVRPAGAQPPSARKVLRFALSAAEIGFDPAEIQDTYSRIVTDHIFDDPLRYDYHARPVRLLPNTLTALPEVSADFRTFTFRVRPGIFFADDPAFNGKRRELVAYMPYKFHVHRYENDLMQPWLTGFRRHPFSNRFFHLVDIDESLRNDR
jgi:hypothetical protein